MLEDSPPKVLIIEGIPGSGKDTLVQTLLHVLHHETRPVYHYPEETMGFSYGQVFWPGITDLRLSIMETALSFIQQESLRSSDSVFVFNRFHLSTACATQTTVGKNEQVTRRYERVIERLHQMRVMVLLLTLDETRMTRLTHQERLGHDWVWQVFLQRVTESTPHNSLMEYFLAQQAQFLELAQHQALPYRQGTLPELLRFEWDELQPS
jgi:thymidylate kinase